MKAAKIPSHRKKCKKEMLKCPRGFIIDGKARTVQFPKTRADGIILELNNLLLERKDPA
jgi:hypothetical protein